MKALITTLVLLSTITGLSQTHFIGAKGGMAVSNVNHYRGNNDFRIGVQGGLTYEMLIKEKINFGVDLLYCEKGYRNKIIFTDEGGNLLGQSNVETYFDYLSLPIKGGFVFGDKIKTVLNIGVVPSLLMKATYKVPSNGQDFMGISIDYTDDITKIDLAAMLEFGGSFALKKKIHIVSFLTFQKSITTYTNDEFFPDSGMKHYSFLLSVGIKYALSGSDKDS